MSKSTKKLEARLAKLQAKAKKAEKALGLADRALEKAQRDYSKLETKVDDVNEAIDNIADRLEDLRLNSDLPETKTVTFSKEELAKLLRHVPDDLAKKLTRKDKR